MVVKKRGDRLKKVAIQGSLSGYEANKGRGNKAEGEGMFEDPINASLRLCLLPTIQRFRQRE
jgi:hypothetical protein